MKKFKNTFIVEGSKNLLEAFEKEVKNIGWGYSKLGSPSGHILSFLGEEEGGKKYVFNSGEYIKCSSVSNYDKNVMYTLPQDYDKALKAASEVVDTTLEDLLKEAEKRGIKKGVKVHCTTAGSPYSGIICICL